MLVDIIMFLFIFWGSLHICKNLISRYLIKNLQEIYLLAFSFLLAVLAYLLKQYIPELTYVIPLLLLWIFIGIFSEHPKPSVIFITISFGISYSLWAISSLLVTLISSPLHYIIETIPIINLVFFVSILHCSFTICLFRIKRFKKGMPFLFSTSFINIGTIICLLFIAFLMYVPSLYPNRTVKFFSVLLFFTVFAFLIHWWQSQITKSYKRSLQLRELESLRMELAEKEKQVVELSRQNQELGRLIHKDNKLIPAMEHAVHEYFITDFATLDDAKNRAQTLLLEIEALSKNRSNIILEMNILKSKHYSTGVPSLDTLLNYMDKRARQEHINLSVHMSIDLNTYIPKAITSEDLVHVLSDLLENAIIASKDRADANIQLQFYESEKHFIIEIGDNGIPFEITSLVNFGLTQFTTHEDTGGSGIGLMDIWKIKEKYSASLHITEYEDNAPFTKKIALIFNKKNRYSISTNRKEDILQQSKRIDLQVF